MSQKDELAYILGELIPQFEEKLKAWNKEYTQERDLGVRGEFVGLYRKTRKLKSIIWDGEDGSEWREDARTILFEVVGHSLLAIYDMDKAANEAAFVSEAPWPERTEPLNSPNPSKSNMLKQLKERIAQDEGPESD